MPLLAVGNPGTTRGALATRLEAPPLDDLRAVPEGSSTLLIMTDEEVTSESPGHGLRVRNKSSPMDLSLLNPRKPPTSPIEFDWPPAFCVLPAFGRLLISWKPHPPQAPCMRLLRKDQQRLACTADRRLDTLHHVGGAVVSLRAKQDTPGGARVSVLLKHETSAHLNHPKRRELTRRRRQLVVGSEEHLLEIHAQGFRRTVAKAWMKAGNTIVRVQLAQAGATISRFQLAGEEGRGPADLVWLSLLQAGIDLSLRTGDSVRPEDIASMHGIRL